MMLRAILAVALLAGGWLLWEKKTVAEERALAGLAFDNFEIKDATFEEALQQVTAKVHALGHPELQLVIYPDASKAPGFHADLSEEHPSSAEGIPGLTPEGNLNLSIVRDAMGSTLISDGSWGQPYPHKLEDVIRVIRRHFDLACALRGRKIVATPTRGTLERYQSAKLLILPELGTSLGWKDLPEADFRKAIESQGIHFYEGMMANYISQGGEFDVIRAYGPRSEVELVEGLLRPQPPTKWQRVVAGVRNWWISLTLVLP